jgi:hypothetical protein
MVQGPRSNEETDYDDDEDIMTMFDVLFDASDETRETGNGTAGSSRVPPEVEDEDGATGTDGAERSSGPPGVGGPKCATSTCDAARSGMPPEVGCCNAAPRSPVASPPPVAGPPPAGSGGAEQLSAHDNGNGKNTDAKTADQGNVQHDAGAAAAAAGKPKAKPKAEAKGRPPAKKAKAGAAATAKADAKADAKSRAKRGTAGTFEGRRPPKDPMKRAAFDQMKSSYFKATSMDKSLSAIRARRAVKKACAKSANSTKSTTTATAYFAAMRVIIAELATAGVPAPARWSTAAAEWQARNKG